MSPEQLEKTLSYLQEHNIPFETGTSLSKYTTFRTGGPAEVLALPESKESSQVLWIFLIEENIDFEILGGGSNLLISDRGYDGLIIHPRYKEKFRIYRATKEYSFVMADASTSTYTFSRMCAEAGLGGAAFLATIPGTLGGALVQNAGCYGGEMSQIVDSVLVSIPEEIDYISMYHSELDFFYRSTIFKKIKRSFIHSISFRLPIGFASQELLLQMEDFKQRRLASQPRNRKSAGSIFKNPAGQKAWQLIEAAGCKGLRAGGALVSLEHANFIVNDSNATSTDIYRLMREVQERVKDHSGVVLEPEVVLLGDFQPFEI